MEIGNALRNIGLEVITDRGNYARVSTSKGSTVSLNPIFIPFSKGKVAGVRLFTCSSSFGTFATEIGIEDLNQKKIDDFYKVGEFSRTL